MRRTRRGRLRQGVARAFAAALERLTIVLVEDNEIDAEVVRRLLRKLPLELPVVRARNGEEALAILLPPGGEETLVAPFIVLLDINFVKPMTRSVLEEVIDTGLSQ